MLSTTSEYALRALTRLARLPQEHAVLGRDLAATAGVPSNYLSKILLVLRNAGFIATMRGTGGGYRLRRAPDQIRLIEIAELFEGANARPACLLDREKQCSEAHPCSAHEAWHEIRDSYVRFLETTTLAGISQFPARSTGRKHTAAP